MSHLTRPRWRMFTVLGLFVLVLAGGLAWFSLRNTTPPAYSQQQTLGDRAIALELDRAEPGTRTVVVEIDQQQGAPETQSVRLRFSMVSMDMGTIEADATPLGNQRFQAEGPFFSMVGDWQIEATLQQADASSQTATFTVPIAAPGEQAGPLNPLGAESASLAEGQRLYTANCSTCHGPTGQGDGPSAAGLDPKPSNFTQHMLPGQHTDGQVFLWIKDGYPGTAMPAWGEKLSDDQIWQLVAYLRSFGQTAVQASPPLEPLPPLLFARAGGLWRAEGTSATRLPTPAESAIASMALSPDGRQLAYVAAFQPKDQNQQQLIAQLFVADADGNNARMLWNPGQGMIGQLTWSPDGQTIFASIDGMRVADAAIGGMRLQEIVQIDLASGSAQPWIEDALDPTLSADGSMLVYLRAADGATEERPPISGIEVAAIDGSSVAAVVDGSQFAGLGAPIFSPDGTRILFAGQQREAASTSVFGALGRWLGPPVAEAHGEPVDLWSVNVDGSGLQRLANLDEDNPVASFSPDGSEIVVIAGGGIYRMQADGSNLRKIDENGGHGGVVWLAP